MAGAGGRFIPDSQKWDDTEMCRPNAVNARSHATSRECWARMDGKKMVKKYGSDSGGKEAVTRSNELHGES